MCNVRGINVPVKQEDVVWWYRELDNLVLIVTEMKLRSSIKSWIANKFEGVQVFTSGLDKGFLGTGVAVIINVCLACHVSKIEEVPGKLLVIFLGLYANASANVRFGQALEVNSLIAKAVNSTTFIVLGDDFNENGSGKSVSFKFCLNLGLVNLFAGHSLVKALTWSNSREVEKTIDYIFISESLSSAVTGQGISSVSGFFDTNHKAVTVSIDLGGFLDVCLNSLCKQANRNCWKFRIKDANNAKWSRFREHFSNRILGVEEEFQNASVFLDLDWINKQSSRFFGLEVLVAKIVRLLGSGDISGLGCLLKKWSVLDADKTSVVLALIQNGEKLSIILKYLSLIRKSYQRSKMYESWLAEKASVRKVIVKHIDKFCSDKDGMIRSVLDCLFHKIVLDYLVVDDSLVLEPKEVKTRKQAVLTVLPDLWARQYAPLDYVQNNVFAGVMCEIGLNKLLSVIKGLPDGKAASLSGIPNELWKHSALIETAQKILSKILFDHISLVCNKFGVLHGDNFLVLKGTSTQSPVFAVGSVVEDVIEKNREIWLVLQDMRKTYDSVEWFYLRTSLRQIKMCDKFIQFFGSIHEDKINHVMTDFGLTKGYKGEVFSPLLWKIFYDLFLCEIGNCQTSIQFALNIASEFFETNNISINSNKTVAILINQGVKIASLSICGQPISVVRKGEAHHYLSIFLFTEAITDKQFSYLVSAVLQPIVNYRIQFSFVSSGVCRKWDVIIQKGLKVKARLPQDFLDAALHHSSLYDLKTFEQIQSKAKVMALVSFFNASGILGHLFNHRFLDLQVLNWAPLNPLQFSVKLHSGLFEVYTDGSLKDTGSASVVGRAAAYFLILDCSVGVSVIGLLSSTITKLQAIVLSLECVLSLSTVVLHLDSQAAINACVSELSSAAPDFHLSVSWVKVKGHSGICGNIKADLVAGEAVRSSFRLLAEVQKWFLVTENTAVSDNTCYFVRDMFQSICHARWEAGPGFDVVSENLINNVNWIATAKVWHPDSHMLAGFTSLKSSNLHMYIMKVVHRQLPVAVQKRLYDKRYPGVLCLMCGEVELLDHIFICAGDIDVCNNILVEASAHWSTLVGACFSLFSTVLWVLSQCSLDVSLYTMVCKGFVLGE
ncbi:hypothetical protein G9A89_022479 [Geosiphon pyriformis]|nr:hypothetical protein G9A89_022479 [Geosiphon pyriformis]